MIGACLTSVEVVITMSVLLELNCLHNTIYPEITGLICLGGDRPLLLLLFFLTVCFRSLVMKKDLLIFDI
jgi:hypothetical protein